MVTVLKEIEIDGQTRRYPIFAVPCDMDEPLELTQSDLDRLKGMHISVEDTE